MSNEEFPAVFVTHAAGILGDTGRGLSGPEIVRLTAADAIDADANIPHPQYPFSKLGINKRTALSENIMAFNSAYRSK